MMGSRGDKHTSSNGLHRYPFQDRFTRAGKNEEKINAMLLS
jgi:hypothetical protein